jgi:hypothetical protein
MIRLRSASVLAAALGLMGCVGALSENRANSDKSSAERSQYTLEFEDAQRFANVFADSKGAPTAAALQAGYLDGASRGVEVFTPYRIESAENLAAAVSKERASYDYAIDTCLPILPSFNNDLNRIYTDYSELLPGYALPRVFVIFGAANSGGTAKPDAQVLALESVCSAGTSETQFRRTMRHLFSHETAHSLQAEPTPRAYSDPLLFMALREGAADWLSRRITGEEPSEERDRWGRADEKAAWAKFNADQAIVIAAKSGDWDIGPEGQAAVGRWFGNVGSAPEGMPSEAGYWIGMQISAAYISSQPNEREAIETLLGDFDPKEILRESGYAP